MAAPLCQILGAGARGPLGLNLLQVAMCARAGKMAPRRTRFADKYGNSIGAVRSRFLPDDLHGFERLVALAVPALREAAASIPAQQPGQPRVLVPLFLALPEAGRPGDDPRYGPEMLAELAKRSEAPIDLARSLVVRSGHAGGGMAIELAVQRLREAGVGQVYLAGGVDSYYEEAQLKWLDAECRLHASTAGNGILPSEAAAFVALGGAIDEGKGAARPIARVIAAAHAREETIGTGEPNLATAMTRAVRDAVTAAVGVGKQLRWVMTDVNGEKHRIAEFTKVAIRNKDLLTDSPLHEAMAEEVGDVGAASGPLFLAIACVQIRAGCGRGDRLLIALHAEAQERSVLVVEAVPEDEAQAAPLTAAKVETPAEREVPLLKEAIDRVLRSLTRLPGSIDRAPIKSALDDLLEALSRWAKADLHAEEHLGRIDEAAEHARRARVYFADAGDGAAATQGATTLRHVEASLRAARDETIDRIVAEQDKVLRGRAPVQAAPAAAPFRAGVGTPVVHASGRAVSPPVDVEAPPEDDDVLRPAKGAPANDSPEALALRELGRDCMEDVAIFGTLRKPNDDEPWAASARFEQRLLANVDALSSLDVAEAGAAQGLDVPVEVIGYAGEVAFADAGRAFARAFTLGSFGGEDVVRALLAGLRRSPAIMRSAQIEALCLSPSPRLRPALERLLWDEDPALVRAALAVLRFRRSARLASVLPLLGHSDVGVLEAAARALGVADPPAPAIAALEELLREGVEDRVAVAALESLVLLGAPSGVALATQRVLEEEARPGAQAVETRLGYLRLIALAGGPEHLPLIASAVVPAPPLTSALGDVPAAVSLLGWFGHASLIEPLLDRLEAANHARQPGNLMPSELEIASARALLRITGVYLEDDEEPSGIGLAIDAKLWRAYWDEHRGELSPDVRLRFGKPYHPLQTLEELAAESTLGGPRRLAAIELAALLPGPWAFEVGDWVARQMDGLAAIRGPLEGEGMGYEAGDWPSEHWTKRRAADPRTTESQSSSSRK
jgi:3-oxoacyl-[acyl-carrier-protein] synthase I